jgi:hypothetical protein
MKSVHVVLVAATSNTIGANAASTRKIMFGTLWFVTLFQEVPIVCKD